MLKNAPFLFNIVHITILGIKGVWIAYMAYCIIQKYLSKFRYKKIENEIFMLK